MKQPSSHQRAPHGMWADKWDPYRARGTFYPDIDESTFDALLGRSAEGDIDPDLLLCYCLDAPRDIPAGSTQCVRTLGDYDREEYNRIPREQTDWKAAARSEIATVAMLDEILEEAGAR